MTVQGSLFPYPRGQTAQQLYQALKTLVDVLNRQSSDGGTLPPGVQSALDAINTSLAALQSQVDGIVANGDLTPQQAFELGLVTRADEIFGSYTALVAKQQTQMQQNADATMLAAIQASKANTGVRTTVRVMNEQNLALAEQINQVSASLGVTNSNVTSLTQAVADGDAALGTQITNVSSQVAGNVASISILTASVNGISTQWAVALNSQNEIIGSIKLDGSQSASNFVINVDNFYVGKAGTAGGTAAPPFAIQTVNGTANMALRGNFIADGTIVARAIQAGAVTADKISANSLAAITANLGTIVAGLLRDSANVYNFDVTNGVIMRTDGTMTTDYKNKVIDITF